MTKHSPISQGSCQDSAYKFSAWTLEGALAACCHLFLTCIYYFFRIAFNLVEFMSFLCWCFMFSVASLVFSAFICRITFLVLVICSLPTVHLRFSLINCVYPCIWVRFLSSLWQPQSWQICTRLLAFQIVPVLPWHANQQRYYLLFLSLEWVAKTFNIRQATIKLKNTRDKRCHSASSIFAFIRN